MTEITSPETGSRRSALGILGTLALLFKVVSFVRLVRSSPQEAMKMSDGEIENLGFSREQIPFISKHLRAAQ